MKHLYLSSPRPFFRFKAFLILCSVSEMLLSFTLPLSAMDTDTDIQIHSLKNLETTPLFYASYPYSECRPNVPFSSKPSISLNLKPNGEAFLWGAGSQKLYIPNPSKNEEDTDIQRQPLNNRERSLQFHSPPQHSARRKSVLSSSEPPTSLNLKCNKEDFSWHTRYIPHHSSKNEEDTDIQRQPLNNRERSPQFHSPRQHSSRHQNAFSPVKPPTSLNLTFNKEDLSWHTGSQESYIHTHSFNNEEDTDMNTEQKLPIQPFSPHSDKAWKTGAFSSSESAIIGDLNVAKDFVWNTSKSDIKEKQENNKKRRNSETNYVINHPLTQPMWQGKDVSTRIKALISYYENAKKKSLNPFEREDIEHYKSILSAKKSDDKPIPDFSMIKPEDLKINSMNPKNANSENSSREVTVVFDPDGKIAIKKFLDIEEGLKELLRCLVASNMNPAPHKLKMARIFDAVINPHNELSIIMEGAETRELGKCLSELFAQHAITACAGYLAKLHIKSDKKLACKPMTKEKCIENLGNRRNRENYINNLANAKKTLSYDLLKAETTEAELLFLNEGSPRKDENRYTGPINAGTIFRSLPLNYRDKYEIKVRKVIKSFIDVSHEIYRSLNDFLPNFYLITATHGDAHLGNFFYNHLADAQKIPWDSYLRICAIDFASMARSINGDNPAVDIARLAASIEAKGYFALSSLFYKTYEDKIVKSGIIEDIEKYKNTFKKSYDFFYLRFLKTIFNLPQEKMADQPKIDLLKRWINENSAHIPHSQEIENNIIHCLPDPLEIFIPSGPEGSLSYLEQLHMKLTPRSLIAILTGLSGVGKKSLALEFAHTALRNKNYSLIYWIPSATDFSLLKAYKNLLLDFGIPVHDKTESAIIELVKQQVPQKETCLLIYAGAPNAAFLKDKIPANVFTLITSQDPEVEQWKRLFPHAKPAFLNVDVFRPEESRQYLYKATGLESTVKAATDSADASIIDDLAELLGHRPLDLATAASSIRLNSGNDIHILNNFQKYFYNIKEYSIIHGDPFEKESSQPINEYLIDKLCGIAQDSIMRPF